MYSYKHSCMSYLAIFLIFLVAIIEVLCITIFKLFTKCKLF